MKKKWLITGGVVVGLLIVAIIGSNTPSGKLMVKEQEKEDSISAIKQKSVKDSTLVAEGYQKLKIEAFIEAKEFCKNQLKAPSTADFGSIGDLDNWCGAFANDDTDINGVLTSVSHKSGVSIPNITTYNVANYVDAQNSFGAKIRKQYHAKLSYNKSSNTWKITDFSFDSE